MIDAFLTRTASGRELIWYSKRCTLYPKTRNWILATSQPISPQKSAEKSLKEFIVSIVFAHVALSLVSLALCDYCS